MGLLYADLDSDLLDINSWTKVQEPVFRSNEPKSMFGPGHNSFTQDENGNDVLVYHCRQYTEIEGDPLWNPDRHTFTKSLNWDDNGMPVFGKPGEQ